MILKRAPVSLTAVLDSSGSMSGSKIEVLKRTAEYLVEALDSRDFLGVITYNDFVSIHSRSSFRLFLFCSSDILAPVMSSLFNAVTWNS